MQNHNNLNFYSEGETFIAEWDNRKIQKDRLTTVIFPLFWIVWAPLTLLMTYNFISLLLSNNPMDQPFALVIMLAWLFFGWYGTIAIPIRWVMRTTVERIEFDNNQYRHYFVNRRWLFPKNWEVKSITKIEYGKRGRDSVTTLSVCKSWKRDLVAYWANSTFRWELFNHLRDHLEKVESQIIVTTI